jgi:hypothetical protein
MASAMKAIALDLGGLLNSMEEVFFCCLWAEDPHLVPHVPSGPPSSVGLHHERLHGDHRADLPAPAAVAALDAFVEVEA